MIPSGFFLIKTKMDRKKLLRTVVFLIIFIFLANYLALKFYWYYSIWYSDMIMHFLGGLWIGLAVIYLDPPHKPSFLSVFRVTMFVLLLGVGWEVYELFAYNDIVHVSFNLLDTLSDIFFDLAGGLAAILYFFGKIMDVSQNTVHPVVEL